MVAIQVGNDESLGSDFDVGEGKEEIAKGA